MARVVRGRDHPHMEVIAPAHRAARPPIGPIVTSGTAGTMLVVGGLVLAYIVFATPTLSMFIPGGHADPGQVAAGMAIWAIALVAPAACILLGTNRLARMLAYVGVPAGRRSIDRLGPVRPARRRRRRQRHRPARRPAGLGPHRRAVRRRGRPRAAARRGRAHPERELAAAHAARLDLARGPAPPDRARQRARAPLAGPRRRRLRGQDLRRGHQSRPVGRPDRRLRRRDARTSWPPGSPPCRRSAA